MANPSPQHNPTDGFNIATQIVMSGTNVVAGKGIEYSLTQSLSAAGGNFATTVLTATLKDSFVPPNTFTSGNSNVVTYISRNTNIATVSGSTITAVATGQAVIDVRFPFCDSTANVSQGAIMSRIVVTVQV